MKILDGVKITGLCSDSRRLAPGNLFIARRGKTFDGNDYIPQAIAAGAAAILTDLHNPFLKTPQIVVDDVEAVLSELAREYYPSDKLFTIGVTGTNGKTISTFLIRHLLEKCGVMGTIECDTGGRQLTSELTTPDLIQTHKLLGEMQKNGCESAALEVTSHAIDQGRIAGVDFDVGLFTNLTQDHLDYHETMEKYADTKASFFASLKKEATAIVNADCPWMSHMIKECQAHVVTYGIGVTADISASDIVSTKDGATFTLTYKGKTYSVFSPLLGEYNISNVLGAFGVGIARGVAIEQMIERLRSFKSVPGRMQYVPNEKGVIAIVDFAHTPDALKCVLSLLQQIKTKRVITVFGCGGNRDYDKRAKMGEIATSLSDFVFVTSDNPRTEDPLTICQAITQSCSDNYAIELDREKAIELAVEMCEKDDILLVAGRGHEKHQIIGSRPIPFEDYKVCLDKFSHVEV